MSGPEAVRGRLPRCTPRPRSAPRVAARHPLSGTAVSVRETRVARAPPAWACRERRPAQVRRPPRVRMLHASLPTQDNKTLQHNLRRKCLRRVASHSAPTSPQVRPDGHSCAETEGDSRAGPTSHPIFRISHCTRFRFTSSLCDSRHPVIGRLPYNRQCRYCSLIRHMHRRLSSLSPKPGSHSIQRFRSTHSHSRRTLSSSAFYFTGTRLSSRQLGSLSSPAPVPLSIAP